MVSSRTRDAVLDQVRACLGMCVGAGCHLYGHTIDPETFAVTGTTDLNGRTAYAFRVDGRRESEFGAVDDADTESIEGTITLDRDLNPPFDARDRVRFEPHTVVHPRFWKAPPDWADAEGSEPPDDGLLDLAIPELAAGAYNPVWWRPAVRDEMVADIDRLLDTRGEAVVLIDDAVSADDTERLKEAVRAIARTIGTDHDVDIIDDHLETTRAVFRRIGGDTP